MITQRVVGMFGVEVRVHIIYGCNTRTIKKQDKHTFYKILYKFVVMCVGTYLDFFFRIFSREDGVRMGNVYQTMLDFRPRSFGGTKDQGKCYLFTIVSLIIIRKKITVAESICVPLNSCYIITLFITVDLSDRIIILQTIFELKYP